MCILGIRNPQLLNWFGFILSLFKQLSTSLTADVSESSSTKLESEIEGWSFCGKTTSIRAKTFRVSKGAFKHLMTKWCFLLWLNLLYQLWWNIVMDLKPITWRIKSINFRDVATKQRTSHFKIVSKGSHEVLTMQRKPPPAVHQKLTLVCKHRFPWSSITCDAVQEKTEDENLNVKKAY